MSEGAEAPSVAPTRLRETDVKNWTLPGFVSTQTGEPIFLTQDALTYFEKFDLFGLVSEALDKTLEKSGSVMAVVRMFDVDREIWEKFQRREFSLADIAPMLDLATIIVKLMRAVPELLPDAYLIFLSVEPEDRNGVRPFLRRIDDATGLGMLETFVAQNSDNIADFLPQLLAVVTNAKEKVSDQMSTTDSSDDSTHSNDSKSSTPPMAEVEVESTLGDDSPPGV